MAGTNDPQMSPNTHELHDDLGRSSGEWQTSDADVAEHVKWMDDEMARESIRGAMRDLDEMYETWMTEADAKRDEEDEYNRMLDDMIDMADY